MEEHGPSTGGPREFGCDGEWLGDRHAVVNVGGELDLATAAQCRLVLDDLQERDTPYHLIVDLSRCTFIDSTGLSLLVVAHRHAVSPLNVVAPHEQVRKTLRVTSLDRAFVVHLTREQALDALRRQAADT